MILIIILSSVSGQIIATENMSFGPPKGSEEEGKSPYFREI